MENNECPRDLTQSQIITEFGKDDNLGKCNSCNHITYESGIMCCDLATLGGNTDEAK